MTRDARIDQKIAAAAGFAQPILRHFRELVHSAVPEVEETIKWGMPHFVYAGKNIAHMAAFKEHCAASVKGAERQEEAMGSFGRLTSLACLPPDEELTAMLRAACAHVGNRAAAAPAPRAAARQKPEIPMPEDFAAALAANPAAEATFAGFARSHRWEYLDWITSAKRKETRARRVADAVSWIAEGKKRNWKYER